MDDCGYSAVLTCIHNLCFEQNYENSQTFLTENCHFYSREISLFIAWECLRYVMIDICAIHVMSNLFQRFTFFTTSLFLNIIYFYFSILNDSVLSNASFSRFHIKQWL